MSDFLDVLAAQVGGGLLAIRPRLPSRFDPVSGLAAGPREPIEVVDESEAAPPQASPVTTSSPRPISRTESPRPGQPVATPVSPRTTVSTPTPRTADAKLPPLRESLTIPAKVVSRESPRDSQSEAPREARSIDPGRGFAVEPDNASASAPVDHAPLAPSTSAAPIVTRRGVATDPAAESAPVTVGRAEIPRTHASPNYRPTTSATSTITPTSTIPTGPPAGENAAAPNAPMGDPSPPTVVVTIGRVEVRAVQPAAPSSPLPSRPQPPRMTLDDYLKRIGGRP